MIRDLREVVAHWRIVHLLGISALRTRYARSALGQTWLALTNAVFVILIGVVWSMIWGMKLDEYLPYVGAGHVVFIFISACINESSTILVSDARLYVNERRPFMLSTAAHIYRNMIVFAHNIPIIVGLLIWSDAASPRISAEYFVFLALAVSFLFFLSYALSLVCARFRDLVQVIALLIQVSFLVTPVMWKISLIPQEYQPYFYYFNPMTSVLETLRNPLIGLAVEPHALPSLVLWLLLSVGLAFLAHRKYGRQIVFWL